MELDQNTILAIRNPAPKDSKSKARTMFLRVRHVVIDGDSYIRILGDLDFNSVMDAKPGTVAVGYHSGAEGMAEAIDALPEDNRAEGLERVVLVSAMSALEKKIAALKAEYAAVAKEVNALD